MAICKKQDYEHQIKLFISHDRLPLTACQFLSILFTSVFKFQVLSVMYLYITISIIGHLLQSPPICELTQSS